MNREIGPLHVSTNGPLQQLKGDIIFTYKESDCSLVIFASSSYSNLVKKQLALYKIRWESIADKIGITDNIAEIPRGASIIIPTFMAYNINPLNYSRVTTIDAIQNLTIYDLRRAVVEPTVHYTKDLDTAKQWLLELPEVFSYDCEATGLDVFKDELTMFSFAGSEEEAFVLSNEPEMEQLVMDFLTTTTSKVIMHNASFDMKIVKHRSGKFIQNFEDTQLLARCYTNHADSDKAKTGLKHLAGKVYGDWATAKDLFGIEHKYNQDLIHYSGIDACATMFLWNEYSTIDPVGEVKPFSELFPVLPPSEYEETPRHFYENVLKRLVPSMIQLMLNGIPLDMEKVANLEYRLDEILDNVKTSLLNNPIIVEFQKQQYLEAREKQVNSYNSKKRDVRQYLKEYSHKDMVMRSWLINTFLKDSEGVDFSYYPTDQLPNGDLQWSVNDIKKLYKNNPTIHFLKEIIDKTVPLDNQYVVSAMIALAIHKTELYNKGYDEKIESIDESILEEFNPGSTLQKQKLFEYLGIEPLATSKTTGAASWGRDQITEVMHSTTDVDIKAMCKTIIEYSQASIIRTTFISAFNNYTIDGVLHGNIRIAGAKTYRPTSDKPNLLNLPSTGSIFAKPIKECMIAPPGKVIVAVDFGQLEDRVIANLTKDEGKCNIFLKDLDSHCYNALGYFNSQVAKHISLTGDKVTDTRAFKAGVDDEHKELKAIRQAGKPVTLTYERLHTVMYVENYINAGKSKQVML